MAGRVAVRALIVGLALVGVAALAACAGDSKSSPTVVTTEGLSATAAPTAVAQATDPPELKDPCKWVTVAEILTTTNKTVAGDPTRVNDFLCRYQTSDGGVVNIGVASPIDKARFEQQTQANYGSGTAPASIEGLGDEAFAVTNGVAVHQGTTSISIQVSPTSDATGGVAAIALAKLILEKL